MATKDTVLAIYTNLLSIITSLGGVNNKLREIVNGKEVAPMLGGPQYTVSYKGSDFENSIGERPSYDNSTFEVGIKFTDATVSGITQKAIAAIHGVKEAVTVPALNVGSLVTSKLVSRVSISKAEVAQDGANVTATVSISIRYREG
jgi:hypothetical protein